MLFILQVIYLFIVSYKVSGSPLTEVNSDLLNDVGSLEVQGYEVHEKLSDRKEQGLPHFVTTTNHRRSSSSQERDGSSSFGQTREQKISVADNIDAHETSGRAAASGNLAVGKEVINIVNRHSNSHATPYNSALSDSIKHSIGDDATFTHKPIIVRSLTLSEVDNGSHRTLPEENYSGRQLSAGVSNVNEEALSASSPPALKAQHSIDSDRIRYRETVRQPYHSMSGSQVETGSIESNGSPFSRVEERKTVLHTTMSPKMMVDHMPTSGIQYDTSIDIQRSMQGEYSSNNENANEEGLSVSYPVFSKAQHNIDSDRIRHKETIHQPYYSSLGSQSFVENNGSPYSSADEKEVVLHTTVFPKVHPKIVHQNPKSAMHDETPSIDVKRGTQGQYSRNDENHSSFGSKVETGLAENNGSPYFSVKEKEYFLRTTLSPEVHPNPTSVTQDETYMVGVRGGAQGEYSSNDGDQDMFKTKKSLSNSMLSSGTQHYLDHSATGDRVNQFPSQPRFILDQNIFERYPSSAGEYLLNHNGFPHTFLSPQFGLESYNSRPSSYDFHHQPTLHHVEHSLRSPSKKGSSPVEEHDVVVLGHGISNHNLYFPSSPDNGGFSFSGIPFIRPPSSMSSYPREEDELGISEGIFSHLV